MKSNFIIIGAMKCATSTVSALLRKHPEVFLLHKVLHFFDNKSNNYSKGVGWYESFFDEAKNEKAIGEICNYYSFNEIYPGTAERIFNYNPKMRLIYITGNPITRIESRWMQQRSQGDPVSPFFNKAVRKNRHDYIDYYNYWKQVNIYRKYFSDEQILVLFTEDLEKNAKDFLRRCFKFLKVDVTIEIPDILLHTNVSEGKIVDRSILYFLRKAYFYHAVKEKVPLYLRGVTKNIFLKNKFYKRPKWDKETLDWVINELANDTRKFLKFYGKNEDFWAFEPATYTKK